MDPGHDNESEGLPPSYEQLADELPACAMCLQDLGTNGGPASLPCGHNGCLMCLLQVQSSQHQPLCPLCRTPFDANLSLQQNTELRDALGRALQASQIMRFAELDVQRSSIIDDDRTSMQRSSIWGKGQESGLVRYPTVETSNNGHMLQEQLNEWVCVSYMPGQKERARNENQDQPASSDDEDNDVAARASITQYRGDLLPGGGARSWCIYNGRNAPTSSTSLSTDINLWDVMAGLVALATGARRNLFGQSRVAGEYQPPRLSQGGFDIPFGSSGNSRNAGGAVVEGIRHDRSSSDSSFISPSAPPLGSSIGGQDFARSLLSIIETEPPQWLADSASTCCMQCGTPFQPVMCFRHHCRFCGGLFCNACSRGRCLLPVQFRQHDPQRVCDSCHEKLVPLQRTLIDRVSNAAQVALHDVTDMSSFRGWLNNPLGSSLQEEIFKATATLRSYSQVGRLKPERSIPDAVLSGASGLAIITVVKLGCMVTYKAGTGLVVARRPDGSWSAPSAIATCGMGWGLQVGGELTDFIIVLRSRESVKAFCGRGHVSLGAGLSVAAGPVGRHAEADLRLGDGGAAQCYSYSCSKGAFVGISMEGSVVATRAEANRRFYGEQSTSASAILLGATPCPRAAAPLYAALQDLFSKLEGPLSCDSAYF